MVDKNYYNCVLSQAFSPCGKYLVCGNNYGNIAVFDLSGILKDEENHPEKGPSHSVDTPQGEQVCSLCTTQEFLVSGTVGAIHGWEWSSLRRPSPKPAWSIQLPKTLKKFDQDVNSLFIKNDDHLNYIYAGCGDGAIHVFSLEDGKHVRSFEGHTDYIHSISNHEGQMASGGEDGSVRLWDLRQNSTVAVIEPSTDLSLSRPHLGVWVGDVHLDAVQLACGGGPRGSLWDLRSLSLVTSITETNDGGLHVTRLHDGSILVGGNDDYFYRFDTNGKVLSKIDTSSSTIYSSVYMSEPYKVLSLAGSGQSIDLCKDFSQRYQVLSFFGESS